MNAENRLDAAQIAARLRALPSWRLEGEGGAQALACDFRFRDFGEAFAFMTRVALLAEAQGHHPDWSNTWNRVAIRLRTHDADGITARDFLLAEAIAQLPVRDS